MTLKHHIDDIASVFLDALGKHKQAKAHAKRAATHARAIIDQLDDLRIQSGRKFKPKVWQDKKNGVAHIILYHNVHNSIVAIGVKEDGSIEGLKKIDGYHDISKELGIKDVATIPDIITKSAEMLLRLKWIDEAATPPVGYTPLTPSGYRARRLLRVFGR